MVSHLLVWYPHFLRYIGVVMHFLCIARLVTPLFTHGAYGHAHFCAVGVWLRPFSVCETLTGFSVYNFSSSRWECEVSPK